MRFHFDPVPESPDFKPDSSWQLLREPPTWIWQLMALPIGIVNALLVAFLWFKVTPLVFAMETFAFLKSITGRIVCVVGVLVAHELLHFAIHPMGGCSRNSILVFWPAKLLLFAAYTGEITRTRVLVMLLMPFLVISILPLFTAAVAQVALGWAAFASTFNALMAGGDLLSAGITLFRIPANAVMRGQGWKTYVRK